MRRATLKCTKNQSFKRQMSKSNWHILEGGTRITNCLNTRIIFSMLNVDSFELWIQLADRVDAATPMGAVLLGEVELLAAREGSESMAASLALSHSGGTLLAMRSSTTFRWAHSALNDASCISITEAACGALVYAVKREFYEVVQNLQVLVCRVKHRNLEFRYVKALIKMQTVTAEAPGGPGWVADDAEGWAAAWTHVATVEDAVELSKKRMMRSGWSIRPSKRPSLIIDAATFSALNQNKSKTYMRPVKL